MITVIGGGVGAARFLQGLVSVAGPENVTAIVNTGDDFELHGLYICPDLDTVRYTLSGEIGAQGWGRADDTWATMTELRHLTASAPEGSRASDWFSLGDRDLATHMYRTQRLREGAPLSTVTAELCHASNLGVKILPMTDAQVSTHLQIPNGDTIDFQEYFVARAHSVPVSGIQYRGATNATPAPGVIEAIEKAERVIVAPSNPLLSIGPALSISEIDRAIRNRRQSTVAISPIVDGHALKGPADHLLIEMGYESSAAGVAQVWSEVAGTLVIDVSDAAQSAAVDDAGMNCVTAPTVMKDLDAAGELARVVLQA